MGVAVRALALNAGSSSLKASVYELEPARPLAAPPEPVWRMQVPSTRLAARLTVSR